ncbi:MAG: glycosyltransferase [Cetobacterium sp.]
MKISVIVSVYNRFQYVLNILKCLKAQTIKPYEIIFADDGSKSSLKEYLKNELIDCDFKVKHVYQEDLGFRKCKSCNNAILEAEGEYLIFLDQDAIFPKTLLEEFVNLANEDKFSILRVLWSDDSERKEIQILIDKKHDYKQFLKVINSDEKKKLKKHLFRDKYNNFRYSIKCRDRGAGLMGIGFGLYKDSYKKVNGYDEDYKGWGGEDADLGLRLYKLGLKSVTFTTKEPSIHMCHPLDPTKVGDKNITMFEEKKKRIKVNKYSSEYGLDNRKDKDGYLYEKI